MMREQTWRGERDTAKAIQHYEAAAVATGSRMRGHITARFNLGNKEGQSREL